MMNLLMVVLILMSNRIYLNYSRRHSIRLILHALLKFHTASNAEVRVTFQPYAKTMPHSILDICLF